MRKGLYPQALSLCQPQRFPHVREVIRTADAADIVECIQLQHVFSIDGDLAVVPIDGVLRVAVVPTSSVVFGKPDTTTFTDRTT